MLVHVYTHTLMDQHDNDITERKTPYATTEEEVKGKLIKATEVVAAVEGTASEDHVSMVSALLRRRHSICTRHLFQAIKKKKHIAHRGCPGAVSLFHNLLRTMMNVTSFTHSIFMRRHTHAA
ncbi:hypothetical protein M758_UG182300 [Ceratodon purpureus]|nr:hypothetical protein M758_UG182300 [Ceratodon purpureus]